MNPLERISDFLQHNISAGIAGGLVYAVVSKEGSFFEKVSAVFVGALVAKYATPFFIDYIGETIENNQFFYAFLIGAAGFVVARTAIRLLTEFAKKPFLPSPTTIAAFLEAYGNRKNKQPSDDKSAG